MAQEHGQEWGQTMRVGLIGCVKSKRPGASLARDMYVSPLFVGRLRAVKSSCDEWFVLSAKHGLLSPDELIEPYDVALKNQPREFCETWSAQVLASLRDHFGSLAGLTFEIHAGSAYRDNGLVRGLEAAGASVENPTEGLNFGQQLAHYGSGARPRPSLGVEGRGRPRSTYWLIGEALNEANAESVTLTFADIEALLARTLPPSARRYSTWWANSVQAPQGRGWLTAGWRVERVSTDSEVVRFGRLRKSLHRPGMASPIEPQMIDQASYADSEVRLEDPRPIPSFTYRWPDATESFDRAWDATAWVDGIAHRFRHALGSRRVFDAHRVHSVTFINGQPIVEGTSEEVYERSRKLVSLIKDANRHDVVDRTDLPAAYEGFDIVRQTDVIDGRWTRSSLAVRITEDDLEGWARHALIRLETRKARAEAHPPATVERSGSELRPPISPVARSGPIDRSRVVAAMLDYGASLASTPVVFTPDSEANEFLIGNSFAFLLAVICDQGIRAERAWAAPWELKRRLGHLDPERLASEPDTIRTAFQQRPMLHRMVNVVPRWIAEAAKTVVDRYRGDAGAIWAGVPSASTVQARLTEFKGISQKKAAMAVEILERDLHVPIANLEESDVAYDVHVRRVFLRTGLSSVDDIREIVANARALHPERPGSLDFPAWDIGRRWCRPSNPACGQCVLSDSCPKWIDRADDVRGM